MSVSYFEESKAIYSEEDIASLEPSRVPQHIAIIMDGNRRWARQRGLAPMMGHWEGAEVLTEAVRAASELGVKTLTVYAFSTENWNRSEMEVADLMNLFEVYLRQKCDSMIRDGVRLGAIGDLDRMPEKVRKAFEETKEATRHCDKINLVLALNYGGRDEIRRAIVKMVEAGLKPEEITEEKIGQYLDTNPFGDPDLLIRTSGEMRVSNFLLWQISYAEIISSQVLWPDFSPEELLKSIQTFQQRKRRLGG